MIHWWHSQNYIVLSPNWSEHRTITIAFLIIFVKEPSILKELELPSTPTIVVYTYVRDIERSEVESNKKKQKRWIKIKKK